MQHKQLSIINYQLSSFCKFVFRFTHWHIGTLAYCSLLIVHCSCSPSTRERSKIPDLPTETSLKNFSVIALKTLGDAISSNPAVAENYYKRAMLLVKNNNFEEALEDINDADKLSPNTGKYLFVKSLIMRNLSKPKEALAIAQKAEILGFNTPDIYTLLGDLYQQNNNFVAADNYLAKSLEVSPYSGDAFYYKAISTARQGDTATALLFLDQSLSFKPRNLQTYQAFSNFHAGLKEYDLALSYNAKGLSLFKNNIDLMVGRGLLMQRIGRADSAIIYYNRISKIQPNYFQSYLYIGGIYFRWKSYLNAIENYNLVKKYNPAYKQIDYLLGLCHEKMNNLAKAEEYFMLATQNNPTDLLSKYALERVSNRINFVVNYYPSTNRVQRIDCVYVEPQKLLDTNRIRINVIQSRAKVNIKTDSLRKIKIN